MSTMAKVFVVINLLLGVAFVTVTCVVFAQQQNYKALADDTAKSFNELRSQAEARISDLGGKLNDANMAINKQKGEIANRDVEIASLKSEKATLKTDVANRDKQILDLGTSLAGLNTSYKDLVTEKQGIQKRLEDEQKLRADSESRLTLAEDELVKSRRGNDKLAAEVADLNNTIAKLEGNVGRLDGIVGYYRERYPSDIPTEGQAVPPPIRAKVEGVNEELGIVMLSVGAEHNVQIGYTFHVYREGSYIGEVQVDRVYPVKSAARIKRDMTPGRIQMGDGATTRLGTL